MSTPSFTSSSRTGEIPTLSRRRASAAQPSPGGLPRFRHRTRPKWENGRGCAEKSYLDRIRREKRNFFFPSPFPGNQAVLTLNFTVLFFFFFFDGFVISYWPSPVFKEPLPMCSSPCLLGGLCPQPHPQPLPPHPFPPLRASMLGVLPNFSQDFSFTPLLFLRAFSCFPRPLSVWAFF